MITPLDGPYVQLNGKKMLDFSSHDFLGLGQHPEVRKSAIRYTLKYGVRIPPAHVEFAPQRELEEKLAHLLGMKGAAFFCHVDEARRHLTEKDFIDDTLTFGVVGSRGLGQGAQQKSVIGTFSSIAAYTASAKGVKKGVLLLPPLLGVIDAILCLVPDMDEERKALENHFHWLSGKMEELEIPPPSSSSSLPRWILPASTEKTFVEQGIFVGKTDNSQVELNLTALHTPDDLDQLAAALKHLKAEALLN
jgi:7-keto-8-aminopelargonate synthetase-like enzyme